MGIKNFRMKQYLIIKKKENQVFKHDKESFDTPEKAEVSIAVKSIQTEKENTEFSILEVGK